MRIEVKYLAPEADFYNLVSYCQNTGVLDSHCVNSGGYYIESTYIYVWQDKVNNISGKLRLRYYKDSQTHFLEEKVKVDNLIYKQRIPITPEEYQYIKNSAKSNHHCEISSTINFRYFSAAKKNLIPVFTEIQYFRSAWTLCFDDFECRMTIDRNVSCIIGDVLILLLNPNECIFEIKGPKDLQLIKDEISQNHNLHPSKISKFQLGYNAARALDSNQYPSCIT